MGTMGYALRLLGATLLAGLIAFGALAFSVSGDAQRSGLRNGAWDSDLRIGSAASDLWLRAQIALCCVLALNRTETIYFSASRDSAGEPLDGKCTYRIEGRELDARWWSVTSYASDNFLIPNPQNKYSVSKTNVERQADGSWRARASLEPSGGNWLPTAHDGFGLTLRLYNPSPSLQDGLATAALPTVTKEACQ
jgi:hypothetical protein